MTINSIYRCSGCGEWFGHITALGDYIPGKFGLLQLCEKDLKELNDDIKFFEERDLLED